jgi:dolichyl-phosphate-mannose-protein mannosyltransferase
MARSSSKRTPKRAVAAQATAADNEIGAALLIVLLVPRLLRLLYPEVWVEDDFYLEAAWLVSAGLRPYLDFVHPHLPLLEWVTAGYLRIFGASHFSIEVLNEAAIYVTSILTFKLAVRVTTRRAAICAAILYATSSLVFRYHVYERECFVAPLVLAAAIAALDDAAPSYRRAGWQALAILTACLIKLTALIPAAMLFAYAALLARRWRESVVYGVALAAGLVAFSALCYWLYGPEFTFQTFLFHMLKGRIAFADVAAYPLAILDIQLPLFAIGCVAIAGGGRSSRAMALVLAIIAAEYIFFGLLSPTAWGHNYLEPLPFITIIGGIGVDWMLGHLHSLRRTANRESALWLGACALFAVVSLVWIAPLVNENWGQGSIYGFGFIPRAEVSQLGLALRKSSRRDEDVVAPAFLCFEAHRRELIRFPETYGVLREAELEYQRDGLNSARSHLGGENFFALIVGTAHFWRDPILAAIRGRKVNSVVPDSPIQLLPLVIPPLLMPPDFAQILADSGLRPTLETEHFVLWSRAPPTHRQAN